MSSFHVRLLALSLLSLFAACQDQMTQPVPPMSAARGGNPPPPTCPGLPSGTSSLVLTPSATTLPVGATVDINVTANQSAGTSVPDCAIKWSSSNTAIATVTNTGVVLGVATGGPVTIKAQSGSGKKPLVGTAFVTVVVPVATVEVTPATLEMRIGESSTLAAVTKDAAGNVLTGRPVSWSSSAPAVANVSAAGVVTGVAAGGPVTITAIAEGKPGSATVTVLPLVAVVAVSPVTVTLMVGQTAQLTATPKDAHGAALTGLTVTYGSSDPNVVSVSAGGLLTALAAGAPVTITATIEGVPGSSVVTVTVPVIPGIEFRQVLPDGTGGFFASAWLRSQATIAGTTFTPVDNPDGLILRLSSNLTPLWAVHVAAGNTYWTGAYGDCCWIAVSPTGTVYAAGGYQASATVRYAGGQQSFSSPNGTVEGLMVQLSAQGTLVSWAHLASTSATDGLSGIATDGAGNVYLSGNFNGCCGSAGTATLTTSSGGSLTVSGIGSSTGAGFKLNSGGQPLWAVRIGARDASFDAVAYDPSANQVVFGAATNSDGSTATLGLGDGTTMTTSCVDGCATLLSVNASDGSYRWHATASVPSGSYGGVSPGDLQVHGGKLFMAMRYYGGPWTLGSASGGPTISAGTAGTSGLRDGLVARYSLTGMVEGLVRFTTTDEAELWWQLSPLPGGQIGVPLTFSGTLTFGNQSFTSSSVREGILVRLSSSVLGIVGVTRLTGPSGTSNGLRGATVDDAGYLVVTGRGGTGATLGGSQVVGTGGLVTRLPPGTY